MCAASAERWPEAQYRTMRASRSGCGALDARLEIAARDVLGARDVAAVPLLGLAHVDDGEAVAEVLGDLGRVDLLDLLLDLPDDLGAGRAHCRFPWKTIRFQCFTKYSDAGERGAPDGVATR